MEMENYESGEGSCCDSHMIGSDPKAINDFEAITVVVKCDHGK